MQITEIRNATVKLNYGGSTFLIDPMLASKGTYPPMSNQQGNHDRNPLVDLPMTIDEILKNVDAIIVTHDHIDHWDPAAEKVIPTEMPIFVQGEPDATLIWSAGFHNIRILDEPTMFGQVLLQPTRGQHFENDAVKDVLEREYNTSQTMGIVFSHPTEKKLFFTGDTIWFAGLEKNLLKYQPDVIVMNAGGNGFEEGRLILNEKDVLKIHQTLPDAQLIADHLDAVNHGTVSRRQLAQLRSDHDLGEQFWIPADGETFEA